MRKEVVKEGVKVESRIIVREEMGPSEFFRGVIMVRLVDGWVIFLEAFIFDVCWGVRGGDGKREPIEEERAFSSI